MARLGYCFYRPFSSETGRPGAKGETIPAASTQINFARRAGPRHAATRTGPETQTAADGRCLEDDRIGAGNETRTRDPNLGKVVLYQLSYSRPGKAAYSNPGRGPVKQARAGARRAN